MSLLLPSVALGVLFGFMRGGNLTRLARFPLHFSWLVILAFLIQFAVFDSPLQARLSADLVIPILHVVSLLLLLWMVASNRSFLGARILGLGLLLNFLVIVANGGYMPASYERLQSLGLDAEIQLLRENGHYGKDVLSAPETRLAFLGDNFSIDTPATRKKLFSVGDVFIATGAFILVSEAMVWRPRRWGGYY